MEMISSLLIFLSTCSWFQQKDVAHLVRVLLLVAGYQNTCGK